MLKDRSAQCSGALALISEDPTAASRRLSKAALEQDFPIAVADQLIVERDWIPPAVLDGTWVDGQEFEARPLPADEVDARLLAALETAGNDRVLRYEAFQLVLGAMDRRSSANLMEADPVVMHAWTLLHCRESWECDPEATMDLLSREMPASTLNLAVDLAGEIDSALERRDFSGIRL